MDTTNDQRHDREDKAREILRRDFWAVEADAYTYFLRVRVARDRAALKALEHSDRAAAERAEVYDVLADVVEAEYL